MSHLATDVVLFVTSALLILLNILRLIQIERGKQIADIDLYANCIFPLYVSVGYQIYFWVFIWGNV